MSVHLKFDFNPFSTTAGRSEASKSAQTVNTIAMGALLGLAAVTAAVAVFTTLPWTIGLGVIGLVALGALGMNCHYACKHSEEVWNRVDQGSIDCVGDYLVRAVREGNQRVYGQACHKLKNQLIATQNPFADAHTAALHLKELGDKELFQFLGFFASEIDKLGAEPSKRSAQLTFALIVMQIFVARSTKESPVGRREDKITIEGANKLTIGHPFTDEYADVSDMSFRVDHAAEFRRWSANKNPLEVQLKLREMAILHHSSQAGMGAVMLTNGAIALYALTSTKIGEFVSSLMTDGVIVSEGSGKNVIRAYTFQMNGDVMECRYQRSFCYPLGIGTKWMQYTDEHHYQLKDFAEVVKFDKSSKLVSPCKTRSTRFKETWELLDSAPQELDPRFTGKMGADLPMTPLAFAKDFGRASVLDSCTVEGREIRFGARNDLKGVVNQIREAVTSRAVPLKIIAKVEKLLSEGKRIPADKLRQLKDWEISPRFRYTHRYFGEK